MSQKASNDMVRVLSGKRLKYTVTIHKAEGKIEFQADKGVKLEYQDTARSLWIVTNDYPASVICPWEDGMVILTEENPT